MQLQVQVDMHGHLTKQQVDYDDFYKVGVVIRQFVNISVILKHSHPFRFVCL